MPTLTVCVSPTDASVKARVKLAVSAVLTPVTLARSTTSFCTVLPASSTGAGLFGSKVGAAL
ncbi:hypothetical protein AFCDBAGC_3904 [Methylobacterium cerastii]|uniref:Uncharacterized protein n=1 Tax=Methylobacterium cerastii TaxID=932741 RepID=A0ABQ4QMR0_9HYPH|nr:hypothetical protein AFCDBAGC_3904 [Methylobacterium cerastii]